MDHDGPERREDYLDNGIAEEGGEIVKRVTLTTIYRKLKNVEYNQNKLCDNFKELREKVEEVNGHKKILDDHLAFCELHRKGVATDTSLKEAYERGRADVSEEADKRAKERMNESLKYWGKIIIPAATILLAALYYFLDRLVFIGGDVPVVGLWKYFM